MVLPSGTVVPPLPYAVGVVVAVVAVSVALWRRQPTVDAGTVVGLGPWMGVGSALYVAYQVDLLARWVAPLASSPTVYGTTFVVAGLTWLAALRTDRDPARVLAVSGTAALALVAGTVLAAGPGPGGLSPDPSVPGLVGGLALAGLVWGALAWRRPADAATTGAAGALVVLGHAVDGVSTAVGLVAGFAEQTPLSAALIEAGGSVATVPVLGAGWLFVLVKVALASVVVVLFADVVRESPAEGNTLLAVVAAVGLGPGVHNLLLFAVASPVPS